VSEAGLKRLEEAFDEAINSTKAAAVEEIVPGGGTALLRAIEAVEAEERSCEGADRTGVHVVRMALEVPTRQIARNAGIDDGPVVEMVRRLEAIGARGIDDLLEPAETVVQHAVIAEHSGGLGLFIAPGFSAEFAIERLPDGSPLAALYRYSTIGPDQ
jgi:chaperonin GroEL (HSP60 family)